MVAIVVIINLLTSLILLLVAWRVWKLRLQLKIVADSLIAAERSTHAVLYGAPECIYTCQQSLRSLKLSRQMLELQISQLQQIISLLFFTQRIWRRQQNKQKLKKYNEARR